MDVKTSTKEVYTKDGHYHLRRIAAGRGDFGDFDHWTAGDGSIQLESV
jgi:hypothetical protein